MSPAQAQTASFSSILDRESSAVEKPKPYPIGSYICQVKGLPRHDVSSKKKTPFVEYLLQPIQAMEDVDQDALNEWFQRKDGTTRTLADMQIKATYYTTEDAIWRLKDFLKHCGLDVEQDGVSLRQLVEAAPGCQVIATIRHESSEDGESTFAKLGATAAVE